MNKIKKAPVRAIIQPALPSDAWYDRAIRFCLYALAALVPAVFTPVFYSVFSTPKLVVLRLLTAVIIVLWGCKVFVEGRLSFARSKLNLVLLVYGAVSIINAIYSIAPFTSLYGAEGRFTGIFTVINLLLLPFFVFNFLREKKSIATFIKVNLVTAGVLAVYGLMQSMGLFSEFLKWNQDPADRVFGTVGHGNHFGAYLGMNILLGVFFFPSLKKQSQRVGLVAGILLMSVVLFLTASRGALFATALALVVCGLIAAVKNGPRVRAFMARWPVKISMAILIVLIAGGLITGHVQKMSLVERTVGTIDFIVGGNIPDRLSWWMSAIRITGDYPFFGSGLGTFRDIYNAYRRADFKSIGPGDMQDLITPEAAHNELLNIAATQGVVGLGAFLAILVFVFWKLDEITLFVKKPEGDFFTGMAVKGALMVYLVQVFFSFGVITTLTYSFLLLGLGAALAAQNASLQTASRPGIRVVRIGKGARYALSFGLIFICCMATYFTFREAAAEYFYKRALTDAAAGDIRGAIEDYQRAVLTKPGEYAYNMGFGDFALKSTGMAGMDADAQFKMLRLAEANYQGAAEINPHHPSVYHNLGITQLQLFSMAGDKTYFDKGAESLRRAVELAVNNPLYPYMAARAMMGVELEGVQITASNYFRQALQIRPGYRDAEALLNQVQSL